MLIVTKSPDDWASWAGGLFAGLRFEGGFPMFLSVSDLAPFHLVAPASRSEAICDTLARLVYTEFDGEALVA